MNTIDYKKAAENTGKYPVTVQGLDFIQEQVLTLQRLALLGGDYYVLQRNEDDNGIAVIDGEIIPITNKKSSDATHLSVRFGSSDIEVGDEIYADAVTSGDAIWTKPSAVYSSDIPISKIKFVKGLSDVLGQVEALEKKESPSLEIMIVGRELYIKHPELKEDEQIFLLRRKRRGRKKKNGVSRKHKKGWYNCWEIVLKKGYANYWNRAEFETYNIPYIPEGRTFTGRENYAHYDKYRLGMVSLPEEKRTLYAVLTDLLIKPTVKSNENNGLEYLKVRGVKNKQYKRSYVNLALGVGRVTGVNEVLYSHITPFRFVVEDRNRKSLNSSGLILNGSFLSQ